MKLRSKGGGRAGIHVDGTLVLFTDIDMLRLATFHFLEANGLDVTNTLCATSEQT